MSKVLIVEDESIFRTLLRDHLKSVFSIQNILEAADGEAGWHLFREHQPTYCIVDLRLPKLRGELLINLMQAHHVPPRILVLTATQFEGNYQDLIKQTDRMFFIEKMAALPDLNAALSQLFGHSRVDSGNFSLTKDEPRRARDPDHLTKRELTILGMIGEGNSSVSIAEILGISVHTVRTHRRNLMQKLEVHNAAALVRYALEHGDENKST